MPILRADLVTELEALELALPDLRARHADMDQFWLQFGHVARTIEDAAQPQDRQFVRDEITRILTAAGLPRHRSWRD